MSAQLSKKARLSLYAICAVLNEKGGVGKTTTALHLGVALVDQGYKVALIGLDPQRDLSTRWRETMQSDRLFFFDADPKTLKAVIREAQQKADFVILDCPPALGPEVAAALSVASTILVPAQAAALSLDAIKRLLPTLDAARKSKNRQGAPPFTWRLLVTMFDTRNADNHMIAQHLRAQLGDRVLPQIIARHPAFESASLEGRSVFEYAPGIRPAAAYRHVARDMAKGWSKLEGDAA
jgi:chromosome partitioning protein